MQQTPAGKLAAASRVLVIAHRGDSHRAPENTLPAFAAAVKVGADLVELDYYESRDGVPVVFHDKTLDRTTNAAAVLGGKKIPLAGQTLATLRRLDAGSWFDRKFAGTKIPTLEESLDVIQAGSMTCIERKGGKAEVCVELLRKKRLLDRVVVMAFDWDYVSECHRLAPDLVLVALGDKELTPRRLDQIEETGARLVGWNHRFIGREQIEAIHRRGLRVWVYTVNDPPRAKQLAKDGINGIISDVPATIMEAIK